MLPHILRFIRYRCSLRKGLLNGQQKEEATLLQMRNDSSDGDPDFSSDNGDSSEAEQGRSSTSKQSRWSHLDEQRLLAYKKEGKSWSWAFHKFPSRTQPAIRTRWSMD
jgi:hypothetical protein